MHWHLAPGTQLRLAPGGAVASTPAGEFRIGVQGPDDMAVVIGLAPVARGFGRSVTAPVLMCRATGPLPVRFSAQWRRAADAHPAASEQATAADYEAGATRSYERSTAAHNTVEIDGANSTQVWGAFRAARRARVTDLAAHSDGDSVVIEAAHNGFRRLTGRPLRRRWSLNKTGLQIQDLITGTGTPIVTVRWHLASGAELSPDGALGMVRLAADEFVVAMTGHPPITVTTESAPLGTGFGRTLMAPVLIGRIHAPLPIRITINWRRSGGAGASVVQMTALTAGGL